MVTSIISTTIQVHPVQWHERSSELQSIRRAVFVVEQQVPEDEEWDDQDAVCQHVMAVAEGVPVGTGRLLSDGHIGRMAVIKPWRGCGVGRAMLTTLLALARQSGFAEAVLHAQIHALLFYEKQGFIAEGPVFMEAGIAHRVMRLRLKD
jgi:predicted GNAT family N-acyltransferase